MSEIKRLYQSRYIHKISPSPNDKGPVVILSDKDLASKTALGKALRKAGVLMSGGQVRQFRKEGDKVVAFPSVPGMTTYWHSIIMELKSTEHFFPKTEHLFPTAPELPPGTTRG
jgi:hypothetical protein